MMGMMGHSAKDLHGREQVTVLDIELKIYFLCSKTIVMTILLQFNTECLLKVVIVLINIPASSSTHIS